MCLPGTIEAVGEDLGPTSAEESPAGLSRRAALAAGGAAALAAMLPARASAATRKARPRRFMDLTHTFRQGFPVYTGDAPAKRTLNTIQGQGFYSQGWTFGEHSGTHLDAPGHFKAGGRLVHQLVPRELFAPAAVIDISARAARDPDASVRLRDLRRYERRHGRIPRGAVVFMYSGWSKFVGNDERFKRPGPDGTFHFPGWGIEAVDFLLESRRIVGLGVDTLSLDIGASKTFDVHKRLLGADRYGIENATALHRIPAHGAEVVVGVIPWGQGSGGPCRLMATY